MHLHHTELGAHEMFYAVNITSHHIRLFIGLFTDLANNDPDCGTDDIQNKTLITKPKPLIHELNVLLIFVNLVSNVLYC